MCFWLSEQLDFTIWRLKRQLLGKKLKMNKHFFCFYVTLAGPAEPVSLHNILGQRLDLSHCTQRHTRTNTHHLKSFILHSWLQSSKSTHSHINTAHEMFYFTKLTAVIEMTTRAFMKSSDPTRPKFRPIRGLLRQQCGLAEIGWTKANDEWLCVSQNQNNQPPQIMQAKRRCCGGWRDIFWGSIWIK